MNFATERNRVALRLATKANIGAAQFSEQPCLDPDLYPRDLFLCFVKGRVAGARSFMTILPLTKAAFNDDGQRNAIANMATDTLRLHTIPQCLANNQYIVGPRGRLPR